MKNCNAESGLKVTPISWPAAIVEQEEADGVRGLAINREAYRSLENVMTEHDLPVEFFNHQLMNCDPDDEQALAEFMTEWGLLFSPFRNVRESLSHKEEVRLSKRSIRNTGTLEKALTLDWDGAEQEARRLVATGNFTEEEAARRASNYIGEPAAGRVVSLQEAAATLRLLQKTVSIVTSTAREGWNNADDLVFVMDVVNAGACNSLSVQLAPNCFYGLASTPDRGAEHRVCLTSAVCNQIIACLADRAPWRVCACEGCGRVFKRKQTKSPNPDSDSKYCCDSCMERQKKRNQRKAAKNRIQH